MELVWNAPRLRDPDVRGYLNECVRRALGRWLPRIRRVRMHLLDVNGPKGGPDQRCSIEAQIQGLGRMVTTGSADGPEAAIRTAARRLVRRICEQYRRRRETLRTQTGGAPW